MTTGSDDDSLHEGLARLFGPARRKRKRRREMSEAEAVTMVKRSVRDAPNQVLAVRRTLASILAALQSVAPPMHHVIAVFSSLFARSKVFRDEFVRAMYPIFSLWSSKQLYSVELLKLLEHWDAQHRSTYPQLHAAIEAIPAKFKNLLQAHRAKVCAASEDAAATTRMTEIQYTHVCSELGDAETAIGLVLQEMEAGLAILVPTVEDNFEALLPTLPPVTEHLPSDENDDDDDDEEWEDVVPSSVVAHTSAAHLTLADVIAQCGLGSAAYSLTITVPALNAPELEHVQTAVKESALHLRKRYLPLLRQWQNTVNAHASSSSDVRHRLQKLHDSVLSTLLKWNELREAISLNANSE
ncbi:hypothetical protein SPRG_06814 [Saprolegnia parasitica CBS 223.65]|uniref:Uncharacterized protein n=1 Tax=Saprolegnia parasitica (strain CBS 223.65) TaxID=695850 RepID=A0A067CLW2_SAPPC|nr:hypothetical protein SPRG_06814 [Saprolegnia parasitica CBS 223.65]KDO27546.1 hypothetical protein SPRG_06814 [Saprolegnia parasitica CBS 223.65]|eukprot:XP_012201672.1 hypothetical protein SPRG_06814 [Saprolegnia parasitica CBS 223.65]